ncbi:hypothetical protein TIFTF001_042707 [Ficus carica]|uniref:Disease resistance RPP13-like protein 1 n=1 Tax=Ficus carica TaxID=3494 RepID=A0AA87ZPU2_FICCA|nr:hypothetical protein TIFTF001_042707 [Ficus carica]
MAELVGGALLSGFLNVLFDRMATQEVLSFLQAKKVLSKLLDELKIRLLSANKLLNHAEVKQLTDENVKKWLDELKEVLYEADYVIDKINTEALRRRVENDGQSGSKASKFLSSISSFFSAFENTVKSEIEEILGRLKLLLAQNEVLGLKESDQKRLPKRLPAPWDEESEVYGREDDRDKIVKLLLSDDVGSPKMSEIAIVGMGGIGKTTLAQLVYNDSRVRERFDLREWVTVSEEVDVFEVTKAVFEKTNKRTSRSKDLYELQDELKTSLTGKRFLYVLDDVWNEDYQFWELLLSPMRSGGRGSRVIVTTRSTIVVSKMRNARAYDLRTITDDDCLQLLTKHAFDDIGSNEQSNFHDLGIEIVKRCKGLPLAVKAVAGVLRSTHPEEWRLILHSDIWELQIQENHNLKILPALWLSYYFLPANLKRCFAYFSIFPKDYEFRENEIEKIIWLWMAEGLLQPREGKRIEDIGMEYFNALKARSFFQQSSWGGSNLVMHDLIHDLAISVSGHEFCLLSDECKSCNLTDKTHHLSYRKNSIDMNKFEAGLSKLKCLHTFLALPLSTYGRSIEGELRDCVFLERVQRVAGCLKVLSFSGSSITGLKELIVDLKHLRYLDLSSTEVEEIPSSICTLYNLQTLLLSSCRKLTLLPTDMCCLINLRHLKIEDTPLREMPPQMYKLRNLQKLSDFVLGENGGSRIKELGQLHYLQGSLCISGLENLADIGDVLQADLKNKEGLTRLILSWNDDHITDDSTKEKDVLAALEPHKKLKKLTIAGYGGTTFPDWVAHESFSDMVELSLYKCKNCCFLPPLGQLPSLRNLDIEYMDGLESIGDEFCGTSLTAPFPSLEILHIYSMGSLERWSFAGAEREGGIFPRLNNLIVASCGKLNVGLPAGCFPSLENIFVDACKEMVSTLPTSQAEIDSAYPSLKSIYLKGCPRLESFSGMGFPSNLKELDIWGCPMLIANRMKWDLQRLSSLQSLFLQQFEIEGGVDSFPEEGLLPSTLTSLSIFELKNLKTLNGKSFHNLTSLQQLTILGCEELQCLPEEGLPPSLARLEINGSPLLEQRCQRGTGEDWPKIQYIPNIEIYTAEILQRLKIIVRLAKREVSKSAKCEDVKGMAFSLLQSQQNNNQKILSRTCSIMDRSSFQRDLAILRTSSASFKCLPIVQVTARVDEATFDIHHSFPVAAEIEHDERVLAKAQHRDEMRGTGEDKVLFFGVIRPTFRGGLFLGGIELVLSRFTDSQYELNVLQIFPNCSYYSYDTSRDED